MNLNDLEATWDQQVLTGKRQSAEELRQHLMHEVAERQRRTWRIMGVAIFVFVTGLAVEIAAHLTTIKPLNSVTLAVSIFSTICYCVAFAAALRSIRRMKREAAGMGGTLLDCVRGSLSAVEQQAHDCTLILWALPVWLVGESLLSTIKYLSGNLPSNGAGLEIAVTLIFAGGIAATVARYFRRELIPRRDELRHHIASLEKSD